MNINPYKILKSRFIEIWKTSYHQMKILNIYPNVFEKWLVFSITKNEHLHVRVNLDLGMNKDISGLRHMVLVARGLLLVVFTFKEPYKYDSNNFNFYFLTLCVVRFQFNEILNWNLIYNYINVFYNWANLKLNFICSWFYNFSFY